jgi:hypothetical protein
VDPEEGLLPQLKHPKSKPYQRQGPTAQELRDDLDLLHLHSSHDHPSSKYKPPANTPTTSSSGGDPETRKTDRSRRALPPSFNSKTTCTLSIQTDPLLWKHISEQERTTDETKIREEILSLIAQHVKAVNHIYSNTLFDGKESYKNIRFEVQRIKPRDSTPTSATTSPWTTPRLRFTRTTCG